jgi:hypothetical protein
MVRAGVRQRRRHLLHPCLEKIDEEIYIKQGKDTGGGNKQATGATTSVIHGMLGIYISVGTVRSCKLKVWLSR